MQISTVGIVIKENLIKDKDKVLTVLTPEYGKISVWAKNAKAAKSKNLSSCQLMAYSQFTLNYSNDNYFLIDSSVQDVFFELRESIEKLSIAQYFCEFCNIISVDTHNSHEVLSLLLNSLFLLCKKNSDIFFIKSVFELRIMSVCGFMPDFGACFLCKEDGDNMLFDIKEGYIVCKSCRQKQNSRIYFLLNHALICAIRHIIEAPSKKIFSFKLDEQSKNLLYQISESFCIIQLDFNFKALDFFKSLKLNPYGGANDE
jgi:DNA repair protein RecO (recombination protein O)